MTSSEGSSTAEQAPTRSVARVAGAVAAVVVAVAMLAVGLRIAAASPTSAEPSEPTIERVAASTTSTSVAPDTTTSTSTLPTTTTTEPAPATTLARQLTLPVGPPPDPRGPEDNPPIGRIAIPAIGLDTELEQGIRLTTLDRGPGHWPGTAEPGQIGNVVVAGHRTSRGAEFRHLDRLVPGDPVVFTTATGTHTYVVTGTQIVLPDALWITDPTDTPTATLFACHPLGSTRERIVVTLALESSQPLPPPSS